MVFSRIKNMFVAKEEPPFVHMGEIYKNQELFEERAAIRVDGEALEVSSSKNTYTFPKEKIDSIVFEKDSRGPAVVFEAGGDRYVFIFTEEGEKHVLLFHGDAAKLVEKVSGLERLHRSEHVCFSYFDSDKQDYVKQDENTTVSVYEGREGGVLQIAKLYSTHHTQPIDSGEQFYVDQGTRSFSWAYRVSSSAYCAYRLVFSTTPTLLSFVSAYINASMKKLGDVKDEDRRYFEKMEIDNYIHASDEEFSSESSDSFKDLLESGEEDKEGEQEDEEEEEDEKGPAGVKGASTPNKEKNRLLAVGKERIFVSRGPSIGIFKNAAKDVEFLSSIKEAKVHGHVINPEKMLLGEEESSLILSEREDREKLYKLDLETGKVAETWNTGRTMKDFFASKKNDAKAFIGVSDNSIFKIDPRAADIVEGKTYSGSTKFSTGDSTRDGEFVIGSAKGEIRMYDKLDKRAKTLLPGLGDPILGVFVSPSGKYMVCTCKSYLMLVSTHVGETSGFHKSLGKDKPTPKKLQIRPEHLVYFGGEVNFQKASISTDPAEKRIVVSTGPYVITWDLQKALRGEVYNYQIKEHDQSVVANSFVPGNSSKIVVALGDDVQLVEQKRLRNPATILSRGKGRR